MKITVPEIKKSSNTTNDNRVKELREEVKLQYEEIFKIQYDDIDDRNKQSIEDLILATEDLINNCMKDSIYAGNRDENFLNAVFICNKLSLKLETYKLTHKIEELNNKNSELESKQTIISEKLEQAEEKSNNLVFNILGFIASFSIVSAAVTAIGNINGIINIVLFMAFSILMLITTLIGLDNFYKPKKSEKNLLRNNYFLWIVLFMIIVSIVVFCLIKDNKCKEDNIVEPNHIVEENIIE